jgi:biopolymer transport protein TolQ
MENETVIEPALGPVAEAAHSIDMSPFALFMQADWVVKSVMVGLVLASIICWAIIFSKLAAYARARLEMRRFEKAFAQGEPLGTLHERLKQQRKMSGLSALFVAAMDEWNGSHAANAANPAGLQARLRLVLDGAIAEESDKLEQSLPFLATVGSAAPFIGLFGTVWGIMNSFTAIAASKDTSLAVVAPGIAEALFATAIGLLAAIPAVIAYNKLSIDAGKLLGRLEAFADKLAVLLSRQADAKAAG